MSFVKFMFNNQEMLIDSKLSEMLASVVWNIKNDNDSVIPVSGSRMVRSGKSTLAQTCAAFCAFLLKKWNMNEDAFKLTNIYFDAQHLIDEVVPSTIKNNVYILDEAYFDLSASKQNAKQQKLLDFFNEVGFKNNIYFLCLPDFYTLKELMAVGRSEILINTYRSNRILPKDFIGDGVSRNLTVFERGYFQCWNRDAKNLMFDIFRTTNRKSYHSVKESFPVGRFTDQHPFPKEEYIKLKEAALQRFKKVEKVKEEKVLKEIVPKEKPLSERQKRANFQRDKAILFIKEKLKLSDVEIGAILGISRLTVINARQAAVNGI